MRTLYHWPLCPFCRKVRLALEEKKLDFKCVIEYVWREREEFLELNPLGQVPVLVEENKTILLDSTAIVEYLDEVYPEKKLLGQSVTQRTESRRVMAYFDTKFNCEVTSKLVFEKTLKRHFGLGYTDSNIIREGTKNLKKHLDYICWLIGRRHWLSGDHFSLADIAAVAHLSSLDYLGHISWEHYPEIYDWYSRVKSRPSMRPLLEDRLPGLAPSGHYQDLDF
tara:strand:+ start:2016 stop:2684 length:669 start_codon:yes stop_codon:yes gene_type:complete